MQVKSKSKMYSLETTFDTKHFLLKGLLLLITALISSPLFRHCIGLIWMIGDSLSSVQSVDNLWKIGLEALQKPLFDNFWFSNIRLRDQICVKHYCWASLYSHDQSYDSTKSQEKKQKWQADYILNLPRPYALVEKNNFVAWMIYSVRNIINLFVSWSAAAFDRRREQ